MNAVILPLVELIFLATVSTEASGPAELCDVWEVMTEEGDLDARIELANCYAIGVGRRKNYETAELLLKDAVRSGSPIAANNFAALILFKLKRESEYSEAVALLETAVDSGAVPAATNLAIAHISGLGVPTCNHRGISLLEFASERGSELANLILYAAYEFGLLGVASDPIVAHDKWSRLANSFDGYSDSYFRRYLQNIQTDELLLDYLFTEEELQAISQNALSRFDSDN